LVEDLAHVERGEREHRDGNERQQGRELRAQPRPGRERQRRECGGDDERPRLDVDAERAQFGVRLRRVRCSSGGLAL
jgi:hypothetical protein